MQDFFPGSNSADGFYSFFRYIYNHAEQSFILKGGPGTGKSTFMKKIEAFLNQAGYPVERFWCASDPDSLDGLFCPDIKTAFVDGTLPHDRDLRYPGVSEEFINLGAFWRRSELKKYETEIKKLTHQNQRAYQKAFLFLEQSNLALKSWQYELEADLDLPELWAKLIPTRPSSLPKKKERVIRHFFGSAITPGGEINLLQKQTEKFNHRILIRGNPATVQSDFFYWLGQTFEIEGRNTLYLHCGLNPRRLIGILLPQEKKAWLDISGLNDFSKGEGDYQVKLAPYEPSASPSGREYKKKLHEAIQALNEARSLRQQVEALYTRAMDFTAVDRKYEYIRSRLVELIS